MKLVAIAPVLGVLALAFVANGQDSRSLTNSESRVPEVISGTRNDAPTGDAPIYERLLLLQNSVQALTSSLANANAEAEMFKRQSEELSLKLQALGIDGLDGNTSKVEQRLIAAVRDLRNSKKENAELRTQLIELTETVLTLIQSAREIPAEDRMAAETQLRQAKEVLGTSLEAVPAQSLAASLSDGMVTELKDEWSLVVANIGDKQGVKIGMTFEVWRNGNRIGEVKVVDVREGISGAVVQNLDNEKNPIKIGDRLRVNARN